MWKKALREAGFREKGGEEREKKSPQKPD